MEKLKFEKRANENNRDSPISQFSLINALLSLNDIVRYEIFMSIENVNTCGRER